VKRAELRYPWRVHNMNQQTVTETVSIATFFGIYRRGRFLPLGYIVEDGAWSIHFVSVCRYNFPIRLIANYADG